MLTDDESFVAKQAPEITDDSSQDEFYDSVESPSQLEVDNGIKGNSSKTPIKALPLRPKTVMPKSKIPIPQFRTTLRPKMLESRVRKYGQEKVASTGTTSSSVVKQLSNGRGRQSLLPQRKLSISINNTINFNEMEFLNSTRLSMLPQELSNACGGSENQLILAQKNFFDSTKDCRHQLYIKGRNGGQSTIDEESIQEEVYDDSFTPNGSSAAIPEEMDIRSSDHPSFSFDESYKVKQNITCGDFTQSSNGTNKSKRAGETFTQESGANSETNEGEDEYVEEEHEIPEGGHEGLELESEGQCSEDYDEEVEEDGENVEYEDDEIEEESEFETDSRIFNRLAPSLNASLSMSYGFKESFVADSDPDFSELDEEDIQIEKMKIEECHRRALHPEQFSFIDLNATYSEQDSSANYDDDNEDDGNELDENDNPDLTRGYESREDLHDSLVENDNAEDDKNATKESELTEQDQSSSHNQYESNGKEGCNQTYASIDKAAEEDEDIQIIEKSVKGMSLQNDQERQPPCTPKTPSRRVFLDDSDFEPHGECNKENELGKETFSETDKGETDGESDLAEDYEDSDEVDEVEPSKRKIPKKIKFVLCADQDEAYLLSLSGVAVTSRNRDSIVDKLIDIYDRRIFGGRLPHLEFEWNARLRKTAGQYYSSVGKSQKDLIKLAVKVLTSGERLRNTLLHELCHCAVRKINNEKEGHGKYFKQWAKHVTKVFPLIPPITTRHNYEINYKYEYVCQKCSGKVKRHSPSVDLTSKCCGRCHGRFDLYKDGRLWKRVEVDATAKKSIVISV
uniref:SprT-like domain-containing protein n=2 Tax=Bursaphelenchus xylophilus TaxID=6326 RepID=A0A1I7SSN3_BURXY